MGIDKKSMGKKLKSILPVNFSKVPVKSIDKEVTIGLDFGTSTTKCIINIEGQGGDDEYYAIQFPSEYGGTLFYPTAVSYNKEKLFFGDLARGCPKDNIIYSCKMAVPCVNSWNDYYSPFMCSNEPSLFIFERYGFSAKELCILYLSNVIRNIKESIEKAFPSHKFKYYLNMACPLDQLEQDYFQSCDHSDKQAVSVQNRERDRYIERSYAEISQYSLILSQYAKNPWDIRDAYKYVNAVYKVPIKRIEESPALIIPETLAAIASYIKRPGTESGRYMTIDIGAGTTDISVFWLQKNGLLTMPHYYSSGSLHIGMDQFDRSLKEITEKYEGLSLREKRQMLIREEGGLENHSDRLNSHLSNMLNHRQKCFGFGYYKETKQSIWGNRDKTNLTMILCGGGSKVDIVKKSLSYTDIWQNVFGLADYDIPDIEVSNSAITYQGGIVNISKCQNSNESLNLLLIAEGLASKIIDIPEYGIETERVHKPQRVEIEYIDLY